MRATIEATPNIAFVKYWGKRDDRLFLPQNSSISATMDHTLTTRTSVVFGDFKSDRMFLDGEEADEKTLRTVQRILDLCRQKAGTTDKAHVASVNEFPTAAGFASSAAGMAALTVAACKALSLDLSAKEVSIIARQGSGSATRSIQGGFVEWLSGHKRDGSDSFGQQLFDETHWPGLKNVIAICAPEKKKVSSRAGMKQTVQTSGLYQKRLHDLDHTLRVVRNAIAKRDGPSLYEAIMRESLNMHAVMLDTWPPIAYLNDTSRRIIHAVLDYNGDETAKAGFTFDAGPN
ncbi:MAG: diphosphomevalonate decarboxylase, partial [Candidatus Micrarchaeota archaeon]|nr:diphosphomevalonate decarboxylase [Candidatus Micrarchaeota archaeon]